MTARASIYDGTIRRVIQCAVGVKIKSSGECCDGKTTSKANEISGASRSSLTTSRARRSKQLSAEDLERDSPLANCHSDRLESPFTARGRISPYHMSLGKLSAWQIMPSNDPSFVGLVRAESLASQRSNTIPAARKSPRQEITHSTNPVHLSRRSQSRGSFGRAYLYINSRRESRRRRAKGQFSPGRARSPRILHDRSSRCDTVLSALSSPSPVPHSLPNAEANRVPEGTLCLSDTRAKLATYCITRAYGGGPRIPPLYESVATEAGELCQYPGGEEQPTYRPRRRVEKELLPRGEIARGARTRRALCRHNGLYNLPR